MALETQSTVQGCFSLSEGGWSHKTIGFEFFKRSFHTSVLQMAVLHKDDELPINTTEEEEEKAEAEEEVPPPQ